MASSPDLPSELPLADPDHDPKVELDFFEALEDAILVPMVAAFDAQRWAELSKLMADREEALLTRYGTDPRILARAYLTLCGNIVTGRVQRRVGVEEIPDGD